MLAWMHDKSVVRDLHTNFSAKTLEDVQAFIESAQDMRETLHLAIASDSDEYMGTVTLRNMDSKAGTAEFAIVVSPKAMGKGYAWFGMNAILEKAFFELELRRIYWCVSLKNHRAIRFYDKHGFQETKDIPDDIVQRYGDTNCMKWYVAERAEPLAVHATES